MYEDDADVLEPFSEQSKEAFASATQELIALLENYLDVSLQMNGSEDEADQLAEMNVELEEVVMHWNSSAYEHTNTSVLMLNDEDEGDEDRLDDVEDEFLPDDYSDDDYSDNDSDQSDESADDAYTAGDSGSDPGSDEDIAHISVIGRWDLNIVDEKQLLDTARAVRRQNFPEETDEEVASVVSGAAQALCVINQDFGNPWLELDGTELHQGTVLYVEPDEPFYVDDSDDDDEDVAMFAEIPAGEIALNERWV